MSGKTSETLLHDLVRKLAAVGQYAEAFAEDSQRLSAVFENRKVDRLENRFERGISFRVIDGAATYFAFTSLTDEKSIIEAADALMTSVKAGRTADISFGDKIDVRCYERLSDVSQARKIDIVAAMDRAATADKRVIQASSSYIESVRRTRVINSLGCDIKQEINYVTAYTIATASDGTEMQTAYIPVGGVFGAETAEGLDFEGTASLAAKLAVQNLYAKNAPAGMMPVVLSSEAGGTMVHEAVGHGLEADLACNGMSVYAGKLGDKVASELITVVDDGTVSGKRGRFIYDDEGTAAKENVLIDRGVLKGYMYDRLYAMKEGKTPTGNGRRQSYKYRPIVRMSNTCIRPGVSLPQDVIASVDKGLFVKRMGGGQVNTVTGDFVFEVTEGYLINNGKIGEPVRNATLVGNGPQVMSQIDMVGNDLGFGMGTCGKDGQGVPVSDAQPTLRIPMITVGGI